MKRKPALAVLFGGNSPEYSVSLQSAYAVLSNLDQERYHVLPLGITRQGRWFLYGGSYDQIAADTWAEDASRLTPVVVSPDPAVHGLLALFPHERRTIPLDAALPILHGGNGEDGTVQGLLQLAGIPRGRLRHPGLRPVHGQGPGPQAGPAGGGGRAPVPGAQAWEDPQLGVDFAQLVGYPLFVKPVNAGSSFGISQIHGEAELRPAIALALEYDTQVILEEAIPAFEVGCRRHRHPGPGGGGDRRDRALPGLLQLPEKYTLKTSAIHVPARVSPDTARRVKETAKVIYRAWAAPALPGWTCSSPPRGGSCSTR